MGIMNKYFFGNPDKPDYTEMDAPATRLALFKRALIERNGQMFLINWLYIVPLLPAAVWAYLSLSTIYTAAVAGTEDLTVFWLQALAVWAPLWWITGPFTAGFAYVHGCWARDENCPILEGFLNGVRDNWKQALAVSAITAVLPLLLYCSIVFYLNLTTVSIAFVLPAVLCGIVALCWLSSLGTVWGMMAYYQMPLRQLLKNALFLTLGNLPRSLLIRLLTLALPLLLSLAVALYWDALFFALLLGILSALAIGFSFNRLIQAAYANFLTETYINARIEGLPTRVGLRPLADSEERVS